MNKQLLKDAVGWGFVLWPIGYALSVMLVALVAAYLICWIIMPFGAAIVLWIAIARSRAPTNRETHDWWVAVEEFSAP